MFTVRKTTKDMKVGRHGSMRTNEHITVCSNSYEKVKTFKYLGCFDKNSILEEMGY